MRLACLVPAKAKARFSLAVAMSYTVACVPTSDLSEYDQTRPPARGDGATTALEPAAIGGPSVGGTPSEPLASPPVAPVVAAPAGNGGVSEAMTGAGAGSSEGNGTAPPLADAGTSSGVDEPDPVAACGVNELRGPNGHCFFFDTRSASWDAARSGCQARGAGWDLASVRSAAESRFLGDQLAVESWIGASFSARNGTWIWVVDNQPFWTGNSVTGRAVGGAYVNWNATEPNGGAALNCVRTLPRSFGSRNPDAPWADLGCGELRGAICEAFPTP